jgi:cell division septation protein DedD
MGDGNDLEHGGRGLSGGQMVMLFLAGAAVCAIFFSIGFLVGYNEKSSKAAPVTEQVSDTPDVPPVITPERPRSTPATARTAPKVETPPVIDQPEPLRPRPLSASTNQTTPPAKSSSAPANGAASLRDPIGGAGSYMIQVAASGTKADGDKLVKALKSMNYPAVLLSPAQAHATDNLFRIQVGPFPTRESAEQTKTRLMKDGFKKPFIKH